MAEFTTKDYTEGIGDDLVAKESVLNDFEFNDSLDFDTDFEGVPAEKNLFRAMPIRKKRFADNDTEGIWLGVDADGNAKINIGSQGTGQLVYNGGILTVNGYFFIGSSGVPTAEHIAVGAEFLRMFNTSDIQTLELSPGTANGGTIKFWDEAGDLAGMIEGADDGGDDILVITGTDAVKIDTGITALTGGAIIKYLTSTPAGGTAAMLFGSGVIGLYFGSGAPSVSAAKGSIYLRTDGSGTNDRAYINTNGSTTWTAIVTVA